MDCFLYLTFCLFKVNAFYLSFNLLFNLFFIFIFFYKYSCFILFYIFIFLLIFCHQYFYIFLTRSTVTSTHFTFHNTHLVFSPLISSMFVFFAIHLIRSFSKFVTFTVFIRKHSCV